MLIPTIIMGVIALVLLVLAYLKGGGAYITGLKAGGNLLLQVAPLLVFAFVIAGMIQVLVPPELIARWIGAESGIRGILIGSVVGGFLPGGPMTSLPILAGLLQVGAGIGTMVAMITGWSLLAVARLPLEVGIMGWQFTLIRLACTFIFPPIAGLLANALFSRFSLV